MIAETLNEALKILKPTNKCETTATEGESYAVGYRAGYSEVNSAEDFEYVSCIRSLRPDLWEKFVDIAVLLDRGTNLYLPVVSGKWAKLLERSNAPVLAPGVHSVIFSKNYSAAAHTDVGYSSNVWGIDDERHDLMATGLWIKKSINPNHTLCGEEWIFFFPAHQKFVRLRSRTMIIFNLSHVFHGSILARKCRCCTFFGVVIQVKKTLISRSKKLKSKKINKV